MLLRPVPDVPVHLGRQHEVAVHGTGVRVEQQLGRVPAPAGPRVPAAVHPEAVPLPRHHPRHEAVPDAVRQLGQPGPALPAVLVEQAQLHALRPARPQRKVGPRHPVRAGAEPGAQRRRHLARPDGHRGHGRRLPRAVHDDGRASVPGGPLCGHRLLLGCAGHLSASRGSWRDDGGRVSHGPCGSGRGPPVRRPPTVLPRARLALTFPRGRHGRFPEARPVVGYRVRHVQGRARAREGRAGRRSDMGRTADRDRRVRPEGPVPGAFWPPGRGDVIQVSPATAARAYAPASSCGCGSRRAGWSR